MMGLIMDINKRKEQLIKRHRQIEAQLSLKEARANSQHRKEQTRRKILVGALIIDHYEKNGDIQHLINWLDNKLEKPIDRKLFQLSEEKSVGSPLLKLPTEIY